MKTTTFISQLGNRRSLNLNLSANIKEAHSLRTAGYGVTSLPGFDLIGIDIDIGIGIESWRAACHPTTGRLFTA